MKGAKARTKKLTREEEAAAPNDAEPRSVTATESFEKYAEANGLETIECSWEPQRAGGGAGMSGKGGRVMGTPAGTEPLPRTGEACPCGNCMGIRELQGQIARLSSGYLSHEIGQGPRIALDIIAGLLEVWTHDARLARAPSSFEALVEEAARATRDAADMVGQQKLRRLRVVATKGGAKSAVDLAAMGYPACEVESAKRYGGAGLRISEDVSIVTLGTADGVTLDIERENPSGRARVLLTPHEAHQLAKQLIAVAASER